MKQPGGKASSRRLGMRGGLASKRAAHSRANAFASTIQKLLAAGFVSHRTLTNELNRRGIATAHGGHWHRTTVVRMLRHLGLSTNGRINILLAHRNAADARARNLAPIVREFRASGVLTVRALTRALNEGGIPTARRGKWHPSSVSRLLQRLNRMHRPSSHHRR
jgi:hypothetical protein